MASTPNKRRIIVEVSEEVFEEMVRLVEDGYYSSHHQVVEKAVKQLVEQHRSLTGLRGSGDMEFSRWRLRLKRLVEEEKKRRRGWR